MSEKRAWRPKQGPLVKHYFMSIGTYYWLGEHLTIGGRTRACGVSVMTKEQAKLRNGWLRKRRIQGRWIDAWTVKKDFPQVEVPDAAA